MYVKFKLLSHSNAFPPQQVKRIYIPLPDENGRRLLLKHNLKGQSYSLPSKNEGLVKFQLDISLKHVSTLMQTFYFLQLYGVQFFFLTKMSI